MKGTEASILIDEFLFDADTSQVDVNIESGEAERTNLASEAQEFIPLLSKTSVTQNGYLAGVDGGTEEEIQARMATGGALLTVLLGKSTAACVAYVLPDTAGYSMQWGAPANGIITMNGTWGVSDAARRGVRIFGGAFTEIGNGATVDLGVGGQTGGLLALHVTALAGTVEDAVLGLEDSADGNTWAAVDDITFSAVGGYTLELSGAIDRYVRLACSDMGDATSISVTAILCK